MHHQSPGGELLQWISAQLEQGGPVTFARFMEWALYHPRWGYYMRGPSIGPRGDFTTSPETTPLFGRLLATHVLEIDALLDRPDTLNVLECGPGRGTLALPLLDALRDAAPDAYSRLSYTLLEMSPSLRAAQEDRVAAAHGERVTWASDLTELPADLTGAVIANEFVDAFPVHLLRGTDEGVREAFVATAEFGGLQMIDGPVSHAELYRFVADYDLALVPGETIEVSLAAADWLRNLGSVLDRGVVTLIDYGDTQPGRYSANRRSGTLLAYSRGAVSDDLVARPGEQDVTALVDFTHLADAGREADLEMVGMVRQASFLLGLGLGEGALSPAAQESTDRALAFREEMQALISMEGLGRFHVMMLSRGLSPEAARSSLSGLRFAGLL